MGPRALKAKQLKLRPVAERLSFGFLRTFEQEARDSVFTLGKGMYGLGSLASSRPASLQKEIERNADDPSSEATHPTVCRLWCEHSSTNLLPEALLEVA